MQGGACFIMRSEMDEPRSRNGVAMFVTDDASGECFMLYFDERKVSRKYQVEVRVGGLSWRRDAPDISQGRILTMSADGNVVVSSGKLSRDGAAWEDDIELTYRRMTDAPGDA